MSYRRIPVLSTAVDGRFRYLTLHWQFDLARASGVVIWDWDGFNRQLFLYGPPREFPYEPAVACGPVSIFIDITNRPAVLPPGFWATERVLIGPTWGMPGWAPLLPTDPLFLSTERSLGGRPGTVGDLRWCGTCGKWLWAPYFFDHVGARANSRTCNRCVMRRDLRFRAYNTRDAWLVAKQPTIMWLRPGEPGYDH
ncbi:hypothetical protein HER10_EVM0006546 [Colletotrichum scovillei]|uniref:Uncharacterized protein n=1 Tax=Colletotrichum scovillei TaxID=1209932 RepID=A0A9P7U8E4_9PEZI|nr:uncharacterized protein HER10_EVM0006546 [Colletotrichum scovillei]KAF4781059.1 hypothetical protein HER10_EVM0006546 [Colletotrichum scovillei]KAG7039248.1 hypothetical protein JMJ78_0005043 [Colletotrichum scovillei]KAG7041394.1 hypothetical protein JMJ77_0003500 [Colletotrichum scovillei]KAG7061421.1 hypothetical protein JMJ76_0000985 [Colletotrichum scovillei]